MCFEVMMATIMVWVCAFGLCEELLREIESKFKRVMFYGFTAVCVTGFLASHKNVNICSLM